MYRTLIVEDDAGTAELERRALERAGHEVQLATTVAEALEVIEKGELSAVLLDYRLPDSEGWPVLEAGKNATPRVPVILVTAQGDERVAAEAARRGAADYVIKRGDFSKHIAKAVENVIREYETERALQQLRELNTAILESVDSCLLLLDESGEIVTVNDNWRRFVEAQGLPSSAHFEGRNYLDVLALDEIATAGEAVDGVKAVLRGESESFTHEFAQHSGGSARWFRIVVTPVRRELVQGAVIAQHDITDRVLAEQEQLRKDALVRNVLASVGEGISAIDASGRMIAWNHAAACITGVARPESLEAFHKALPAITRDGGAALDLDNYPISRALQGESTEESVVVLHRGDGQRVHVAVSSQPIRDEDGEVAGAVTTFRDISESILRQRELQRLASAVEQATLGIYITDVEGTIQYVNSALERLSGFEKSELQGARVAAFAADASDAAEYQKFWNTAGSGGVWSGRMKMRGKDQGAYSAEVTIGPIRDDRGEIAHFVVTQRDCEEQVQLEDQLRQSQKMEAVGQLAGGVAHDFNNQLAIIIGYSELISAGLGPDSRFFDEIQQVLRASESAAGLTRQLLAFSRRQVLQPQRISLNDVVEPLEKMLRRLIPENIKLELMLSQSLGDVSVDPGQIEQVVVNLVNNSRDAMPDGGRIAIETRNIDMGSEPEGAQGMPAGSYVRLSVSDTGAGIGGDVLPHIFEPFFTTKDTGKGTGLGLATVYGIVRQSGGYIRPSSTPGQGTRIDIYLPLVSEQSRQPSEAPVAQEHSVEGAKVLIIEDDQGIKALVENVLRTAGCEVSGASSCDAAQQALEQASEPFDVVLSDVVLPDGTGPQVVQQVRNRLPEVRAIFMSGYTSGFLELENVMQEGDEFIEKPFRHATLMATLERVLATRD